MTPEFISCECQPAFVIARFLVTAGVLYWCTAVFLIYSDPVRRGRLFSLRALLIFLENLLQEELRAPSDSHSRASFQLARQDNNDKRKVTRVAASEATNGNFISIIVLCTCLKPTPSNALRQRHLGSQQGRSIRGSADTCKQRITAPPTAQLRTTNDYELQLSVVTSRKKTARDSRVSSCSRIHEVQLTYYGVYVLVLVWYPRTGCVQRTCTIIRSTRYGIVYVHTYNTCTIRPRYILYTR